MSGCPKKLLRSIQKSLDFYTLARKINDERKIDLNCYQATMLKWGIEKLDEARKRIPNAGGLVIAPSIKVAEAAKVIENSQRDLNIALINEFSIIFKKIGIDTRDVLDTANTKWNFLRFLPGLVGGHCISVDPYYLRYRSLAEGYSPELISLSRRINNYVPYRLSNEVKKFIKNK